MLWHDRQRKIVLVAARVADLKVVAVHGHDRAVGQVAEGAADWVRARVADERVGGACFQTPFGRTLDGHVRPAVDRDSVGNHLVRLRLLSLGLEGVGVGRAGIEGERALDCEG